MMLSCISLQNIYKRRVDIPDADHERIMQMELLDCIDDSNNDLFRQQCEQTLKHKISM